MNVDVVWRREDGMRLPAAVWRAGSGRRMISSAMVGGGIGPAEWVLNAQVAGGYSRLDPVAHLHELAALFGLSGPGVGLLTAAAVDRLVTSADEGVEVVATVGLRVPTWAAAASGGVDLELAPIREERRVRDGGVLDVDAQVPERQVVEGQVIDRRARDARASRGPERPEEWRPGTINIVVSVPAALSDAALVNAVATATEAKTQALLDAGYHCSGTATDAVCVAVRSDGTADPFGGPRSRWGARIARAVHAAVREGALDYTAQLRRLTTPTLP